MKYDCNKTLDYVHEIERMCKSFEKSCNGCELAITSDPCKWIKKLTQETIDIVQKWSDEHPEKRRQDILLELFPNAKLGDDGVIGVNPCCVEWSDYSIKDCKRIGDCNNCRSEFWNEVIK